MIDFDIMDLIPDDDQDLDQMETEDADYSENDYDEVALDDDDFDDDNFDDDNFDDDNFDDDDLDDDDFDDDNFDDDDLDDDDLDDDNFDDDDLDDDDLDDDFDGEELYAYGNLSSEAYESHLGEADSYENFDPEEADIDDVIGDVEEDMDNWHEQEGNTCAVCAQEFVLEALTGREFDMDELRELAEENGWYDNGTILNDVGNLLEYHGIQVERMMGGDVEDIETCLNAGGKVIVGVDSSELWSGINDDFFYPGLFENDGHAVQVIGLDYSNPEEPMVILNDSGVANGCGAMISLEQFQDAWEDYDGFMVMAYN